VRGWQQPADPLSLPQLILSDAQHKCHTTTCIFLMDDSLPTQLQHLYTQSPLAQAFFDYLVQRRYDSRITKVDRLLDNLPIQSRPVNRKEIILLMQRLAALGVGRFILGRRSQPSRFEWSVSLLAVARAATGDSTSIDLLPLPGATSQEDSGGQDEEDDDLLEHHFHLRPGLSVGLELPIDMSEHEAERLAAFIKTLPFRPFAGPNPAIHPTDTTPPNETPS
jgi:hypothetical protein